MVKASNDASPLRKRKIGPYKNQSVRNSIQKKTNRRHDNSGRSHHRDFSRRKFKITCEPSATELLKRLMGGAFNARYMSIERPHDAEEPVETEAQLNKAQEKLLLAADDPLQQRQRGESSEEEDAERLPFHVKTGYSRVLEDEPIYRLVSQRRLRFKRRGERRKKESERETKNERRRLVKRDADGRVEAVNDFNTSSSKQDFPTHLTQSPLANTISGSNSSSTIADSQTESVVRFLNSIAAPPPSRRRSGSSSTSSSSNRSRRSLGGAEDEEIPWKCESRVVWEDLGPNYFPRYLRTVECLGARCWFGHFKCSPKAFTVKVLKRQSDECVPVSLPENSDDDVQVKYEEEWVFEERSITFCCECVR